MATSAIHQKIINAFISWFKNDPHSESEDYYTQIINKDYLSQLTQREFISFFDQFAKIGGKVQSGGQRTAPKLIKSIEENYSEFRKKVLEPFNSNFNLDSWLEWAEEFLYFGKGLASIYLNRVDKRKYVIVNNKSVEGLNALGFDITQNNFSKQYYSILEAEKALIQEFPELDNYFRADALMHFIIGTEEGSSLLKNKPDMEYFDLKGMIDYAKSVGNTYNANDPAASWYYETRDKLKYLVGILENSLKIKLNINYSEQPNAQAGPGRIVFKDYVLTGFMPDNKYPKGELFIKLAFHSIKANPVFDIELDINAKIKENPYFESRNERTISSRMQLPVNQTFPGNWDQLVAKIQPHVQKLIKEYYRISSNQNKTKTDSLISLNTILYGPPGTGKTYKTIIKAAEIVEGRKIEDYDEALDIFNKNLHDQIEFITFHQNYSYEDFVQGLRPDTENDKELTFQKRDGIFKILSERALKNLKESENPSIARLEFDKVFNSYIEPLSEGEEIEVKMKKTLFHITQITDKSIEFRKNKGDSQHTLSINTLRQMYNKGANDIILGGLQPYYNPILDILLEKGKTRAAKVQKKNYVLIIDEINRANISRVFGELITLIEPDKRSHGKTPIEVKLPSGDLFIVPSNLYIIGTMNTADKSIALLDIALRRRFVFEAMYPEYEIPGCEIFDIDVLKKINELIIKTKGHDFQIGHAYFMDSQDNLVERMNQKVIPLLLEYYMNDENEVKKILYGAGLEVIEDSWLIRVSGKRD